MVSDIILRAQDPLAPLPRFSHMIYTDLRGHQFWIKIGKNLPIGKCQMMKMMDDPLPRSKIHHQVCPPGSANVAQFSIKNQMCIPGGGFWVEVKFKGYAPRFSILRPVRLNSGCWGAFSHFVMGLKTS